MAFWHMRRSAITFDLGAAGIRACQLELGARAARVRDSLHYDRVAPVGAEGGPAEVPQLERLLDQGRFARRSVALVLPPPEVQFYPLRLPDAVLGQSPDRLAQAVQWEAAREAREAAEKLEVRYWHLPRGVAQPANVMAVTLPTGSAEAWRARFAQQGLTLERINVAPCALVRLALCCWTPLEHELWGVLDLGRRHITLTVVLGRVPTYIRTVAPGTETWTQRLAQSFDVPPPVAEQLKREHGVCVTDRSVRPGAGPGLLQAADLPAVISSLLRDLLQGLAREVGRCFSYVMQTYPETGVKGLLLAGGGAALRGLPLVLAHELGIPVHALHGPAADGLRWEKPIAELNLQPLLAAAVGAALLDLEAA
jgi:Tfp pilus assembly PilM family ATPase